MKKLNILFEDKHLLVVYKESGLSTVRNDKYNDNLYSMVYDYLHKKNQRVFVVTECILEITICVRIIRGIE